MTYKIEKIIEEQSCMKAELKRIDSDIKILKEEVKPMRVELTALERGLQKVEYGLAANDSRIEMLRNEIIKQYNELNKKLEPLPDIQVFVSNVKFGAWVAGLIIAAGFTFVAGVSKVLLDMNGVLNLLAGS